CVCPGDGCQPFVCALKPSNANTTQTVKSQGFIIDSGLVDPVGAVVNAVTYAEDESNKLRLFFYGSGNGLSGASLVDRSPLGRHCYTVRSAGASLQRCARRGHRAGDVGVGGAGTCRLQR